MRKPIWIDGKPHRWRRGKLVEIPAAWLGKVTSRQTINGRPSKAPRKLRGAPPTRRALAAAVDAVERESR